MTQYLYRRSIVFHSPPSQAMWSREKGRQAIDLSTGSYISLVLLGRWWRQQCNSSGSKLGRKYHHDFYVRKRPSPVYVLCSLWHDPTPQRWIYYYTMCLGLVAAGFMGSVPSLPCTPPPPPTTSTSPLPLSPPHPPSLFPGKQGADPK